MTNVNDVYPSTSKSLKAEDLKNREVKAVIESHEIVDFDNGQKVVLKFTGKEKGLVLNKTNSMKIADSYGYDVEGWYGKELIMYPDKTDFGGKMVDCIRVRIPLASADDDVDLPF